METIENERLCGQLGWSYVWICRKDSRFILLNEGILDGTTKMGYTQDIQIVGLYIDPRVEFVHC